MTRRDGWTGGVLVLALVAAMIWILLPSPAHAQKNVTSAFDVRLGGYVQMNVTWDSDENTGDNPSSMRKFATVKDSLEDGRSTLRWAATRTRLFMDVRGPDLWGAKSRAYTEFDWDGLKQAESGGVSATAAHTPRLRRAYMRFDWAQLYLLLGQDTLIFDRAVGSASEVEGVSSGHGDITAGSRNRAPQITIGTSVPMAGAKLDLIGSASRHATDNQPAESLNDSGARSGKPALQAMAQATLPVFGRNAIAAASYYWGEETLTSATSSAEKDVNSTGLALEFLLPLGPAIPGIGAFDARGSWFTAENMARWNLGNNSLTSNSPTGNPREVSSDGWWAELNWEFTRNFAAGAGLGHVEDDKGDVVAIGGTTQRVLENDGWWIFATWKDGPWMFLVQYSKVDTDRIVPSTGAKISSDSEEVHFIFRYTF